MPKPIPHVLLFLLILSSAYSIIIQCPEIEKEALLLSFKKSLEDPSNLLSSWNTSNCCNWKGVVCSNVTGVVHQLHLQGNGRYSNSSLHGKINPSLLKLKHLKYLDLSRNLFDGRIPSFMGSLTSLEYLNLSGNGFYGKIPPTIGNLSGLHTLDLGGNIRIYYVDDGWHSEEKLEGDSVEWLRGLYQLEHLNMNLVNLTEAAPHWMQVINALPSLVDLRLRSCGLNFNFVPPSDDVNITSLAILDLSSNNFESFPIPNWIFKQSNLIFLDLSGSQFRGPIPTISNITKLQYIDLSFNYLNSPIPDWLYSCKDLEFVSLEYNSLQSRISNAIGNLTSLTTLDISANQLSGEIPRGILNLCKLQELKLSKNMLQGKIPDMPDLFLRELRLSDNNLSGNLPMSMGQLYNLKVLDIENNKMRGVATDSHFANLTKLTSFVASGNYLTLNLSSNWNPPFRLQNLKLGSWNLGSGSHIPSWLETQKSTLGDLDLSNTGISDTVPTWFWNIPFLNISHNQLSGSIPVIGYVGGIYLNSNQFSGHLPRVGNTVLDINLSNNLFFGGISHFLCDLTSKDWRNLNLEGNQLTGEIPNCWMKMPDLAVVNLGLNNFSGSIPNSIGVLKSLFSLNLRNNKLSGQIPVSISNCTELVVMDLSENDLIGNIPRGIGTSLTKLRLLILRSNKLRGTIPWSICLLNSLQIFDLSSNSFSGRIPQCLSNLTAMTVKRNLSDYIGISMIGPTSMYGYNFIDGNFLDSASVVTKGKETHYDTILSLVNNIDLSGNKFSGGIPEELTSLVELKSLNLSRNHLTGSIPKSIGDLKQLESLDLSRNILSGEMPNSFSSLSFLSFFNVSFNNLSGRIPESTQFERMDAWSFVGNYLCGPPLTKKCRGDDDDDVKEGGNEDKYQDDKPEVEWLYVFSSLGYALGLSAFCTTLVFKRSRRVYYRLLECMWDKLYVYYYITCRKLTRRKAQAS
ncbi:hypothetical protein ACS0TY_036789 [Phlomoides rotata]